MAMINEDRPYAAILMNDGTEISHYGVKGMKWGKSILGKVKGLFGKPKSINTKVVYRNDGHKNIQGSVSRNTVSKISNPLYQRRRPADQHAGLHGSGWRVERDADGRPVYSKSKKSGKYSAPSAKTKK